MFPSRLPGLTPPASLQSLAQASSDSARLRQDPRDIQHLAGIYDAVSAPPLLDEPPGLQQVSPAYKQTHREKRASDPLYTTDVMEAVKALQASQKKIARFAEKVPDISAFSAKYLKRLINHTGALLGDSDITIDDAKKIQVLRSGRETVPLLQILRQVAAGGPVEGIDLTRLKIRGMEYTLSQQTADDLLKNAKPQIFYEAFKRELDTYWDKRGKFSEGLLPASWLARELVKQARAEAALQVAWGSLPPVALDMVGTLLRESPSDKSGPVAYALALDLRSAVSGTRTEPLRACFTLTPEALQNEKAGPLLLWAPGKPLTLFSTPEDLRKELQAGIHPDTVFEVKFTPVNGSLAERRVSELRDWQLANLVAALQPAGAKAGEEHGWEPFALRVTEALGLIPLTHPGSDLRPPAVSTQPPSKASLQVSLPLSPSQAMQLLTHTPDAVAALLQSPPGFWPAFQAAFSRQFPRVQADLSETWINTYLVEEKSALPVTDTRAGIALVRTLTQSKPLRELLAGSLAGKDWPELPPDVDMHQGVYSSPTAVEDSDALSFISAEQIKQFVSVQTQDPVFTYMQHFFDVPNSDLSELTPADYLIAIRKQQLAAEATLRDESGNRHIQRLTDALLNAPDTVSAYRLSLRGDDPVIVPLSGPLAFTSGAHQPYALFPQTVLYIPAQGMREFDSLANMETFLRSHYSAPHGREALLSFADRAERGRLPESMQMNTTLHIGRHLIEGDAVMQSVRSQIDHQIRDIRYELNAGTAKDFARLEALAQKAFSHLCNSFDMTRAGELTGIPLDGTDEALFEHAVGPLTWLIHASDSNQMKWNTLRQMARQRGEQFMLTSMQAQQRPYEALDRAFNQTGLPGDAGDYRVVSIETLPGISAPVSVNVTLPRAVLSGIPTGEDNIQLFYGEKALTSEQRKEVEKLIKNEALRAPAAQRLTQFKAALPALRDKFALYLEAQLRLDMLEASLRGELGDSTSYIRGLEVVTAALHGDPDVQMGHLRLSTLPEGHGASVTLAPWLMFVRNAPGGQDDGVVLYRPQERAMTAYSSQQQFFQYLDRVRLHQDLAAGLRPDALQGAFARHILQAASPADRPAMLRFLTDQVEKTSLHTEQHLQFLPFSGQDAMFPFNCWADNQLQNMIRELEPLACVPDLLKQQVIAEAAAQQYAQFVEKNIPSLEAFTRKQEGDALTAILQRDAGLPAGTPVDIDRVTIEFNGYKMPWTGWVLEGLRRFGNNLGGYTQNFIQDANIEVNDPMLPPQMNAQLTRALGGPLKESVQMKLRSAYLGTQYAEELKKRLQPGDPIGSQLRELYLTSMLTRLRLTLETEKASGRLSAQSYLWMKPLLDNLPRNTASGSTRLSQFQVAGRRIPDVLVLSQLGRTGTERTSSIVRDDMVFISQGPYGDEFMPLPQYRMLLGTPAYRDNLAERVRLEDRLSVDEILNGVLDTHAPTAPVSSFSDFSNQHLQDMIDNTHAQTTSRGEMIWELVSKGVSYTTMAACTLGTGGMGALTCAIGSTFLTGAQISETAAKLRRGERQDALTDAMLMIPDFMGLPGGLKAIKGLTAGQLLRWTGRRHFKNAGDVREAIDTFVQQRATLTSEGRLKPTLAVSGIEPKQINRPGKAKAGTFFALDGKTYIRDQNRMFEVYSDNGWDTVRLRDPQRPGGHGAPIKYRNDCWQADDNFGQGGGNQQGRLLTSIKQNKKKPTNVNASKFPQFDKKITPEDVQKLVDSTKNIQNVGGEKGVIYRGIVFRGDTRVPKEIFQNGFQLREPINNISEVNGIRGGFGGGANALDPDGKGISTSSFYKKDNAGAYYYGGGRKEKGYTYVINAKDKDGYHLYANRHLHEHPNDKLIQLQPWEINYGEDIPASSVMGVFDKNGAYTPNPSYIPH